MPPRFVIVLALLAGAGGAASAKSDEAPDWRKSKGVFCAVLGQVLAAAREPEPYASLRVNLASDPNRSRIDIPAFERCHVRGDSFRCSRTGAPSELTLENLTADTHRCLGGRVQPRDDEGFQVFEMGKVAIQIESECSDECVAGRVVNYRVEVN